VEELIRIRTTSNMQFHHYKTLREPSFKGGTEDYIRWRLRQSTLNLEGEQMATMCAALELSWVTHDRPYYNVYPIAVELCIKTALNMKWGDITFPVRSLLLRFAKGFEPMGMCSVLARVPSCKKEWSTPGQYHTTRRPVAELTQSCPMFANIQTNDDSGGLWVYVPSKDLKEEVIKDSLAISNEEMQTSGVSLKFTDKTDFLIRLLAFIGLLARGTDLVTPAILASDRKEYDATSDECRKRWLEDRARRKLGMSFDVGRSLEIEKSSTPHWRSPHLALFHTGPGRQKPVLKVRSGCVVIPRDMSEVPTGYLGKETKEELDRDPEPIMFRTPIPKKLRFKIMRRDAYKCRLCGMNQNDGVRLQVDHIVPVAKGGRTEERNLWTLCQPCNSGKSDMPLHVSDLSNASNS
jgi:hypothetical protein